MRVILVVNKRKGDIRPVPEEDELYHHRHPLEGKVHATPIPEVLVYDDLDALLREYFDVWTFCQSLDEPEADVRFLEHVWHIYELQVHGLKSLVPIEQFTLDLRLTRPDLGAKGTIVLVRL